MHSIIITDSHESAVTNLSGQLETAVKNSPYMLQESASQHGSERGAEGLVREAWWNEHGLNKQHGYRELWDRHQVC